MVGVKSGSVPRHILRRLHSDTSFEMSPRWTTPMPNHCMLPGEGVKFWYPCACPVGVLRSRMGAYPDGQWPSVRVAPSFRSDLVLHRAPSQSWPHIRPLTQPQPPPVPPQPRRHRKTPPRWRWGHDPPATTPTKHLPTSSPRPNLTQKAYVPGRLIEPQVVATARIATPGPPIPSGVQSGKVNTTPKGQPSARAAKDETARPLAGSGECQTWGCEHRWPHLRR